MAGSAETVKRVCLEFVINFFKYWASNIEKDILPLYTCFFGFVGIFGTWWQRALHYF